MPPAWEPSAAAGSVRALDDPPYDRPAPGALGWHVVTQFAPLVPGTMLFIYWRKTAPPELQWGAALFMAATLVSLSALVDGRPWARALESTRLLLLPLLAMTAAPVLGFDPTVALAAGALWAAPGFWWIRATGSTMVPAPARTET
jgi:hypothetical protein